MKVRISIFISNFVVYVNVTRETGQKGEGVGGHDRNNQCYDRFTKRERRNKLTPVEKKKIEKICKLKRKERQKKTNSTNEEQSQIKLK